MLWKSNTFSCLTGRRKWSKSICLKFDLACGAWRQGSYWAARIGYCPLGLSTAAARAAGKHPREPGKDRLLPVCAAALSAQLSCSEIWRLLRRRLSDIKEKESGQLSCQQKKPPGDHYYQPAIVSNMENTLTGWFCNDQSLEEYFTHQHNNGLRSVVSEDALKCKIRPNKFQGGPFEALTLFLRKCRIVKYVCIRMTFKMFLNSECTYFKKRYQTADSCRMNDIKSFDFVILSCYFFMWHKKGYFPAIS